MWETLVWSLGWEDSLEKGMATHSSKASLMAQTVKSPPAMWEIWFRSLGWEDPLKEGMATHSSVLTWRNPVDSRTWRATVHGVTKSQTQMSDTAHTWAVNMFWILTPYQSYHLHVYFFSFSDCLLIVLMVFLAVRKLLSLIRPHLLIFDFVSITPGDGPKKIRLWLMSVGVQPVFSLEF